MSERRFRILVNPVAGRGRAPHKALPVAKLLREAGAEAEIVNTTSEADAAQQAEACAADGVVAVAAGGDGMVALVAGAVVRSGGLFGIVPGGRGNDFARQLGLDMSGDAAAIAAALREGPERQVDVIEAAGRTVLGSVYAGVDSRASVILDRTRWVPGPLQYRYAALRALATYRPETFTVTVDGTEHVQRGANVVVANSGYYGSGMHIAPDAQIDDGLLDVVIIDAASRWALVRSLPKVYDGRHVTLDEVTVLRGASVTVAAEGAVDAYADGDRLTPLPVTAQVRPEALRVIGPPAG